MYTWQSPVMLLVPTKIPGSEQCIDTVAPKRVPKRVKKNQNGHPDFSFPQPLHEILIASGGCQVSCGCHAKWTVFKANIFPFRKDPELCTKNADTIDRYSCLHLQPGKPEQTVRTHSWWLANRDSPMTGKLHDLRKKKWKRFVFGVRVTHAWKHTQNPTHRQRQITSG